MSEMTLKTADLRLPGGERLKAITSTPGWLDELTATDTVRTAAQAYALAPLIYRAVRLRCDAISSVPMHIYRGEDEVEWPFECDPVELIWRTEAGMLMSGAAYWLKTPNARAVRNVTWLNPSTVQVELGRGGLIFKQESATANSSPWTAEKIVYFREFHPSDDVGPGVGAAEAAVEDAKLLRFLTRFAAHYFEHGAMPVTLIGFEYAPSTEEAKRIEGFLQRQASGIKNAWRMLALRGKIEPKVLTPVPKDLAMKELNDQARHNVAMAFGIPQTMLEDAANYATAGEHRLSFWQDTVRPRGRLYEGVINRQLLGPIGMRISFDFEEMGIFQVDEAERSGALNNLVGAGFDTLTAAEVLGYTLTAEQRGRIEKGADLGSSDVGDLGGGEVGSSEEGAAARADLRMWERMAKKRVRDGKGLRAFESEAIPASLHGAVAGALEAAGSVEQVGRVFADVWERYP